MSSKANLNLPVINFPSTELMPESPVWETVKSQVRKAAEEYRCFEVQLTNINQELRKAMDGALEEVFALPLEIKKLNVSDKLFQGYIESSVIFSLHEGICLEDSCNFDKVESFTNNMWPQGNINFSETVYSFSKKLAELDQTIRKIIVESFGLEKYLDEHMNSTYNYLKFTKYEAPKSIDKKTGLRTHTDKTITTILYQNQIDGLEVQTKGGEWIKVKFSKNSIIVIIGESLNAWTNGRLYSPYHRVMMSGNKIRYCAILFTVPTDGHTVKAVEELVDEEHPLQFKPFKYPEFLKLRFEEDGKNFDAPLKAYFGA